MKAEEEGKGPPSGRWQYPACGVGAGPVQLHVGGLLHTGHGVARLGGKAQRAQDVAGQHTSVSDQELTQRMSPGLPMGQDGYRGCFTL